MFKFAGRLLLGTSVFFTFYIRSMKDRCTFQFLIYTIEFLNILQTACLMGQTYVDSGIISNSDKITYYKNFKFHDRESFFKDLEKSLIDKNILNIVSKVFYGLGRRNVKEENMYISDNISVLKNLLQEYRERYISCNKENIVRGLSVSMIMIIVLL